MSLSTIPWCLINMRVISASIACISLVLAQDNIFQNDLAKVCRPLDRSLDLLFILDGSGSTSGSTFHIQKDMVDRVVDQNRIDLKEALQRIRHISGTTKTGRALTRAMYAFSSDTGARRNNPRVAQVAVVVSDGHSHDDPVAAAKDLRNMGVTILAVGIGQYVNMKELVQIAGDEALAFKNDSVEDFVKAFEKIAIGENCEYAKGSNGAEITCGNDTIDVESLTTLPLSGHLYVPGYFGFQGCTAKATAENPNSVTLKIPLNRCGIQKQFLFEPRGLLFETKVILKFHPEYHTEVDKPFTVRCFYPDTRLEKKQPEIQLKVADNPDIAYSLDQQEHQVSYASSSVVSDMHLPCRYSLRKSYEDNCILEDLNVGDSVTHVWQCDTAGIGDEYRMLVQNCFMTDGLGKQLQILDEHGCTLDGNVMPTPAYLSALEAVTLGGVVKYADHPMVKFRCSLFFCNKNKGECDSILPPKCDVGEDKSRKKRDASPISDRISNMPPYMLERLFRRRQYYEQQAQAEKPNFARLTTTTEDRSRARADLDFSGPRLSFPGESSLKRLEPVQVVVPVQSIRRNKKKKPTKPPVFQHTTTFGTPSFLEDNEESSFTVKEEIVSETRGFDFSRVQEEVGEKTTTQPVMTEQEELVAQTESSQTRRDHL